MSFEKASLLRSGGESGYLEHASGGSRPRGKVCETSKRNALISKHAKATTVQECVLFLGVWLVKRSELNKLYPTNAGLTLSILQLYQAPPNEL